MSYINKIKNLFQKKTKDQKIKEYIWHIKNLKKKQIETKIELGIWKFIVYWVLIILIIIIIRSSFTSLYKIDWSSMNDTFYNWEFIFVDNISYNFKDPKFWDIIIFTPPIERIKQVKWLECFMAKIDKLSLNENACIVSFKYIKRVIWEAWDVIKIENWKVYRNWKILDESKYLNKRNNWNTFTPYYFTKKEFIVPDNSVFVLWDNRSISEDSRYWKNFNSKYKNFIPYKKIYWKFLFRMSYINNYFWPKKEKNKD